MRDEIAELIGDVVASLRYPVGMGIPPNPETMKRLTDEILKIVNGQQNIREELEAEARANNPHAYE